MKAILTFVGLNIPIQKGCKQLVLNKTSDSITINRWAKTNSFMKKIGPYK